MSARGISDAASFGGIAAAETAPSRVLIIINDPDSGPRGLPQLLQSHGVEVVIVDATTAPLPSSLNGFSGLVMLGAGMMPDDDEKGPWLEAERALAHQAIQADIATLGICLGAQILALVGGGRVVADGPTPERGVTRIDLLGPVEQDSLFSELATPVWFIENHRDFIAELPAAATHLAYTERCPAQAFRLGSRVWGVQFHPEVPPERALEFDPAKLASDGFDPGRIVADAERYGDQVRRGSETLLTAFAELVAGNGNDSP